MHSSRMRTACLLPISPWSGGVPGLGGVPGGGCTSSRGCTWLGGVPGPGDVPGPGGCVPGPGVYLVLGGVPPPVNRMKNRYKNITLPQTSFAGGKKTAAKGGRINFVFLGPPYPAAGSATELKKKLLS